MKVTIDTHIIIEAEVKGFDLEVIESASELALMQLVKEKDRVGGKVVVEKGEEE